VPGTPVTAQGGPLAGHTLRFAASVAGQGAQIPAIIDDTRALLGDIRFHRDPTGLSLPTHVQRTAT
jgi:hypothetical protein